MPQDSADQPAREMTVPQCCGNPVFVIGAPRSGTTALGLAIGQHSGFHAGDETFFLADLFDGGRAESVHARWAERPSSSWIRRENVSLDAFLQALGTGVDVLLTADRNGRRWVDHTPGYALMMPTLGKMLPGAKFIHIVRDGREVVNSMFGLSATFEGNEEEKMREAAFLPEWARSFRMACEAWVRHVSAAAEFCRANPGRCLTVMQLDLEKNPDATLAGVFRFLGVGHEDAPVEFLKSWRLNSSFAPPGGCPAKDYRRPDPLAVWTEKQKFEFDKLAGPLMESMGFESGSRKGEAPNVVIAKPARRHAINDFYPGAKPKWDEKQERSWQRDIDDPEFWRLAGEVWDFTFCNTAGLHHLYSSCRYVLARGIPGALVECGAMFGGGVMLMAETCRMRGGLDRSIYALDTFVGSLRRCPLDLDIDGKPIGEPSPGVQGWLEMAEENIRSIGWPERLMRIVPGDIVQTAPALDCDPIALLKLDTDTYDTTLAELESLYPRVAPGGVVILGNFGWSRGQRLAFEKYFASRPVNITRIDSYSAAFVKVGG